MDVKTKIILEDKFEGKPEIWMVVTSINDHLRKAGVRAEVRWDENENKIVMEVDGK